MQIKLINHILKKAEQDITEASGMKCVISIKIIDETGHEIYEDLETILDKISEVTEISVDRIKSRTRKRETVVARQMYCKFARLYTKKSFATIGVVCNIDHATVLHSCKTIDNLCLTDKTFNKYYLEIKNKLNYDSKRDDVSCTVQGEEEKTSEI